MEREDLSLWRRRYLRSIKQYRAEGRQNCARDFRLVHPVIMSKILLPTNIIYTNIGEAIF